MQWPLWLFRYLIRLPSPPPLLLLLLPLNTLYSDNFPFMKIRFCLPHSYSHTVSIISCVGATVILNNPKMCNKYTWNHVLLYRFDQLVGLAWPTHLLQMDIMNAITRNGSKFSIKFSYFVEAITHTNTHTNAHKPTIWKVQNILQIYTTYTHTHTHTLHC